MTTLEYLINKAKEKGFVDTISDKLNYLLATKGMRWFYKQGTNRSYFIPSYFTGYYLCKDNNETECFLSWRPLTNANQAIEVAKHLGARYDKDCNQVLIDNPESPDTPFYLNFLEIGQPACQCLRYLYATGKITDAEFELWGYPITPYSPPSPPM